MVYYVLPRPGLLNFIRDMDSRFSLFLFTNGDDEVIINALSVLNSY